MFGMSPIEAHIRGELIGRYTCHVSLPLDQTPVHQGHALLRCAKALERAGETASPEYSFINARRRRMRKCVVKHRVLCDRDSSSACACPALSESYLPGVTRILTDAGK